MWQILKTVLIKIQHFIIHFLNVEMIEKDLILNVADLVIVLSYRQTTSIWSWLFHWNTDKLKITLWSESPFSPEITRKDRVQLHYQQSLTMWHADPNFGWYRFLFVRKVTKYIGKVAKLAVGWPVHAAVTRWADLSISFSLLSKFSVLCGETEDQWIRSASHGRISLMKKIRAYLSVHP